MYQMKMPSQVFGGSGSIAGLRDIIMREAAERVFIFTDQGIRKNGLLEQPLCILAEMGVSCRIFDQLKAEPSYQDVEKIVGEMGTERVDLLIAVGGGSVMDTAKLCSLLTAGKLAVRDLLKNPHLGRKQVKTVMIPTTCGTGAEATCNAIVAIPEEETKQGIVSEQMLADYVILDPQMIARLPGRIVAATGVDALAHAVECYTSKKATAFSDLYALEGARLIFGNIRRAYSDPDDMEAKSGMMLGAFYGGAAITGSGTTAVHALAYPLGGKYHIAHGVSNAILFAHVMKFNRDACEDRLAALCDYIAPERYCQSVKEKAEYVIREIADIVRYTEIPTDLSEFGVSAEDLDFLTEAAERQQRLLKNNRKEMTPEDIRRIYQKVLKS